MNVINYIAGISLLFLVSACGDKNTKSDIKGETWQLVEMTAGMVPPSDQEGELSMSQTYVFTPEMTFTKQQTKDASHYRSIWNIILQRKLVRVFFIH